MKILSLVENHTTQETLRTQHGLSLYIQWKDKKLLFDTGADGLFLENARRLGIDISEIDAVILSHGHYDHGGGIAAFLRHNLKAQVYVQQQAFGQYLSVRPEGVTYIGLDQELKNHPRLVFCQGKTKLYPGCYLFDGVTERSYFSPANKTLLQRPEDENTCSFCPDEFVHEQYLVLQELGKTVLFGGCCHNGILNVLGKAKSLGYAPDVVISGFHFAHMEVEKYGTFMDRIAQELCKYPSVFYTCHCTGYRAFERMRLTMGQQLHYLACGDEIEI